MVELGKWGRWSVFGANRGGGRGVLLCQSDGVPKARVVGWILGQAEEAGEVYGRDRARREACRRGLSNLVRTPSRAKGQGTKKMR